MDKIERKTMQDIKDYVKSLDTPDNEVYQQNKLLIMSCFSKAIEIIEENAKIRLSNNNGGKDNSESIYKDGVVVLQEYEYEMFFNSEPNEPIQIHGWYPIATDRIRHPEKIEHYIKTGLLRRIKKQNESNKVWVCNECNMPNFTQSVSKEDVEQERVSCINCGCFEFHLENRN